MFAPLQAELSQLVFGTAYLSLEKLDAAFELLDEWVRLGGTVLDTAATYGVFGGGASGDSERVIGRWLDARPELRERIVLISKGGHPHEGVKRVTPKDVARDLRASCGRLGVESIDIYMLHRDDPEVEVGPLVEMLNEHKNAGHIRSFGASNWGTSRIDDAAAYAAARNLESFTSSSCNFALARQNEPQWPGALSVSDLESRRWYEETQLPLFSWSAQAGGFFAVEEARINENPDLRRVYVSRENRERRIRAAWLADARALSANEIALAWVLNQRFPTYPIIGPRSVAELRDSIVAVDCSLTAAECAWLDLESDECEELREPVGTP